MPRYTDSELHRAFDAVTNPLDWRGPINVTIEREHLEEIGGWPIVRQAIEHFTATTPKLLVNPPRRIAYIRAAGYRAGPAGDH